MSGVQSIERAFAVLRVLAVGPAGVSEVATKADLPKSTVARLLNALEAEGAVAQDGIGGPYRIGSGLADLASSVQPIRTVVATARPHLAGLADATNEVAGVSVLDGSGVLYLEQIATPNPVQVQDWTGERVPLHLVSSGLVLLAFAPRGFVDSYLRGPLERRTEHSVVSPGHIRDRLRTIRRDGWAWVFEEFALGISSVAAPVRDAAGTVVAAVHAHGPAYRFPGEAAPDDVAALVVAAADRISSALGYAELHEPSRMMASFHDADRMDVTRRPSERKPRP